MFRRARGKEEKPTPVRIMPEDMDQYFSGKHIETITFGPDRLPEFKKIVERIDRIRHRQQEFWQRRQIFRQLVGEWLQVLEKVEGDKNNWRTREEKALDIFGAYSGTIYKALKDAEVAGWDGKDIDPGMSKNDEQFFTDARWRLSSMVDALEAGATSVSLQVPSDLAHSYENWLLGNLERTIPERPGQIVS